MRIENFNPKSKIQNPLTLREFFVRCKKNSQSFGMAKPLANDLDDILTHTKDLWEELRGKRLFIAGGTGFVGCWLLESLLYAHDRLNLQVSAVVLTRNIALFRQKAPHLAYHPAIYLHQGDVRSFSFPSGQFSHLINAATEATTLSQDASNQMWDTITEGTKHTLEFARHCGACQYLLTSSGAIYGKQPSQITHLSENYLNASSPNEANSVYAQGKQAAERLCAFYAQQYGIEAKIARCFALVGPYLSLDTHLAIGNFMRDGFKGGPILVKGDGTSYRSYLYAADLAIWLWTILLKGESLRPYNVGSSEGMTIAEVAKIVASTFVPPLEVQIAQKAIENRPPERYVPAIDRALTELNLRTRINLAEAVRRTIVWHYLNSTSHPHFQELSYETY